MIVHELSDIAVPTIPNNQFRKWVLKRRFSAELKKRRVRQMMNPAPQDQLRRYASDNYISTRELVLEVEEYARSLTDEKTMRPGSGSVQRQRSWDPRSQNLPKPPMTQPYHSGDCSNATVSEMLDMSSEASLRVDLTPEQFDQIHQEPPIPEFPVATEDSLNKSNLRDSSSKKPKLVLQFDESTLPAPPPPPAPGPFDERRKSHPKHIETSTSKSSQRSVKGATRRASGHEVRVKKTTKLTSMPDYTYHNKSPFKSVSHWVNRQVSVFGRFWASHLDSDHYSYITHIYPTSTVDHDMTLPLSNYFISSGHNSYLTGNQMTSACSPQPLVAALKKGCRVIELDIWNDKKGPRVVHGFTMTKPVDFEKCIKSVRKYAFYNTETPLIITLENHCNDVNRDRVVKILNEELGELIHWTKQGRKSSVKYRDFPSPASLSGRVLIRDKDDTIADTDLVLSDRENTCVNMGMGMGESTMSLAFAPVGGSMKGINVDANGFAMSRSTKNFLEPSLMNAATCAVNINNLPASALSSKFNIASLFGGNKTFFTDANQQREAKSLVDFISIINVKSSLVEQLNFAASFSKSEASLPELTNDANKFRKITQRHLLRVYPHARRLDSSNYDPFAAWLVGAQIVAMNWQTPGVPMWVYKGFFLTNGGCGFVRKPSWLMSDNPPDVNEMPITQMLSVQILSARNMGHRFAQDNYVQVDLYGVPKDTCSFRTTTAKGIDACTWDDVIHMPVRCVDFGVLLVMLRYKEVVVGHVAIPLASLKQGIFAFPLLNKYCKPHVSRKNISVVLDIQLRPATGNLKKLLQGE
eukprot:c13810_g2_i1.p1 GENE.c13810_g2_i1~~c13810_g2_i1.p1  ORF type:complete len:809 (+),score=199.21 c13810_g2_i1:105-2531(+)